MLDCIAHVCQQLPSAIMFYHKRFKSPFAHIQVLQIVRDLLGITDCCLKSDVCFFIWDPTRFLKKLRLGLYFALGTVYSQFSCVITRYDKWFQRTYAHVVALQIICNLLSITDGSATIDVCFPMWIAHTHLVEPCAEQLPD